MKKCLSTKALIIFFFVSSAAMVSCKKEMLSANNAGLNTVDGGVKNGPNGKVFSVSTFKTNLKSQIFFSSNTTQPRGYTFVINKDGKPADSASFGIATLSNGGSTKQHTNQEINIASVSKTMTAVAVLQLLKKTNRDLGGKIGEWLPASWKPSTAIKNITFEQLLTHSSGISESNTAWSDVKNTIKGSVGPKTEDVYANMNFALFRVIIPYMQDVTAAKNREKNPGGFEAWLSEQYLAYMQQKIFTPIGMGSVTCKPSANSAQGFSEMLANSVSSASVTFNDWTQFCGGGGFYMSSMEMARFMAYLSHSNVLLDETQRSLMNSNYLGWDDEDSQMTIAGRAYGKDGALWTDSNNSGVRDNGDAGIQTFIVRFPNKVELSLAINSIPGGWRNIATFVTNAYNSAWINQ